MHDPATFSTAPAGGEAACYLVHSLSDADFQRDDAGAAEAFGHAAARAGLARIGGHGGISSELGETVR